MQRMRGEDALVGVPVVHPSKAVASGDGLPQHEDAHIGWMNGCRYRRVSRQPAASASSTEQNQRVPLLIFIWIFAYQRLVGW